MLAYLTTWVKFNEQPDDGSMKFRSLKFASYGCLNPLDGSEHPYKYSLALVVAGECVLRYDNERGKGDHKHEGEAESAYVFTTLSQLLSDFKADIRRILNNG